MSRIGVYYKWKPTASTKFYRDHDFRQAPSCSKHHNSLSGDDISMRVVSNDSQDNVKYRDLLYICLTLITFCEEEKMYILRVSFRRP